MEAIKETQAQRDINSRWQTIGLCIGMIAGFCIPKIGLGLGMLLGIALGRLILARIPITTPIALRAQKRSAILFLIVCVLIFMDHWYVPLKHAIANFIN
ncbi:hypothetical protein [Phocaeicola sp.]|jgi:hypothetical protein